MKTVSLPFRDGSSIKVTGRRFRAQVDQRTEWFILYTDPISTQPAISHFETGVYMRTVPHYARVGARTDLAAARESLNDLIAQLTPEKINTALDKARAHFSMLNPGSTT